MLKKLQRIIMVSLLSLSMVLTGLSPAYADESLLEEEILTLQDEAVTDQIITDDLEEPETLNIPDQDVADIQPDEDVVIESGDDGTDADIDKEEVTKETSGEKGWDGVTTKKVYEQGNIKYIFTITNSWSGGYNAKIGIFNDGSETIDNWVICMDYQVDIVNIWNAVIDDNVEGKYTIKNASWNADILSGESVDFGFSVKGDFTGFPDGFDMIGIKTENDDQSYALEYYVDSEWESGFTGRIAITNISDETIEDWKLVFSYNRKITSIWNASIESHEENKYVLKNMSYNANIQPGQTITFGFKGEGGSAEDAPFNYILETCSVDTEYLMKIDTDGDGLMDGEELEIGTNHRRKDTDEDGLTDYEEIYMCGTDPLRPDTDDNGINDGDEDLDKDGIANIKELEYGTNPADSDTDGEGLTDYEELIVYGTDPLVQDTDNDGLNDYDEVKLGLDPLSIDTDGDGIEDSVEVVEQNLTEEFDDGEGYGLKSVSVSMKISGNIENEVGIINVREFDELSNGVVGLVGVPIEIRSDKNFDKATITFKYDGSSLGDTDEKDLSILWYDEENDWYQIMDRETVLDIEENTVSLETTHFSTYMLVDSKKWYEAWRENIDYRVSSTGDKEKNYFDIAFVVDVSGSMNGSGITGAIKAMRGFVDALVEGDEAALITFNNTATTVRNFTGDKKLLNSSINTLNAAGGTNVNSGLVRALNLFSNRSNNRERSIVLICDGDVNYYQNTIDQIKKQNIKVYTINVQGTSSHYYLEKIASQTGGQYFYETSGNDLTHLMGWVQDLTVGKIDKTDKDKDELYDVFETAGIRLSNGRIIYTDPGLIDTDRDGLTDYEETGIVYNIDSRYVGNGEFKLIKYFKMHSDPTMPDTDGDNIIDKDDKNPWFADGVSIDLRRNYENTEYINIKDVNGKSYIAGNQGWWNKEYKFKPFERLTELNSRISSKGCGVIAMTDMEIYLTQQTSGRHLIRAQGVDDNVFNPENISFDKTSGEIGFNDYISLVQHNALYRYDLFGVAEGFTGVIPVCMENELDRFNDENNMNLSHARWAPYNNISKLSQSKYIIKEMEDMITNNIPCVFSYYTRSKKQYLRLYISRDNAVNNIETKTGAKIDGTITGHYMTIVGMYKYLAPEEKDCSYILKVASWGDIYYVRYDMYKDNLSYFTNILSVSEK